MLTLNLIILLTDSICVVIFSGYARHFEGNNLFLVIFIIAADVTITTVIAATLLIACYSGV
jgi:hypothetical protein